MGLDKHGWKLQLVGGGIQPQGGYSSLYRDELRKPVENADVGLSHSVSFMSVDHKPFLREIFKMNY